ncbi:MAG: sigma 54-interacting transcriptional regulator [Bryobacteraceae bacterium]|jgi:PAS domain S-box-containing protein
MCFAGLQPQAGSWLVENGPREIESLFRTTIYESSAAILITDGHGMSTDASAGACKLLGLSRDKIIGRQSDEFCQPGFTAQVSQQGLVLPSRHLLLLHATGADADKEQAPSWAADYALFLLDVDGNIVAWYPGAERIYGYTPDETIGRPKSILHPNEDGARANSEENLKRAAHEGHFVYEGSHVRKDGARFWANVITMALRDEKGELQGYARVVRDFSDRHERDEKLRRSLARVRPIATKNAIAGVVSGQFDRILEANDAFLKLAGYSRAEVVSGLLHWPDLTPPEFIPLDELAYEEGLRFGACTPYEKELVRKDGTRVPVLVATAVLKLSPFRWITFVQDLRDRDRIESIEDEDVALKQDFEEIVGTSTALRRVQRQIEVVAPTDANVLILGETGTGKELVARAIHKMSPRRNLPFITLNCAAIPTGLLESELFGYERGAFTGALSQKIGRFEMAHRGTLFLDEVGDIPLDLQPKLLRALQEKAFERLGGTKTIPIDVRLVAATNRNLTQMMGDKLFRSDLYYRLKVFPITTPPLRDHSEDIPILARHFTKKYAAKMSRQIDKIPSETMRALSSWNWPGNVRELENFIERSVILSRGPNLRAPLAEIRSDAMPAASSATLEQVEREHILKVLRESGGVVTTAATRLGLHRTTLNAMMRKLGISRGDF